MEQYYTKTRKLPKKFSIDDLSEDQKKAFMVFRSGHNVFITGSAGTGKTYLINKIREYCNKAKLQNGVTAMTGCAAYLINGNTLHSWAGIGLGKSEVTAIVKKIKQRPFLKKRWKYTRVLLIDEVSMLDMELFDKLDQIARLVRDSSRPWGGIQLCLFGDMCQLPPCNNKFCFESERWDATIKNIVILDEIKRQENITFCNCLNEMRLGNISEESYALLKECCERKWDENSSIIPTRLYSYNKKVDETNSLEFKKLDTPKYTFRCHTRVISKNGKQYNKKQAIFVSEMMNKTSQYVEELELAVGAQVMLTINLDIKEGLVNGSRGVVVRFEGVDNRTPVVRFIHGIEKAIENHVWDRDDNKFMVEKTQLPLKLAWACSIHKIQGATLDYAIIDIEDVFEYGQAYVALSRIKDPKYLYIKSYNPKKIKCHPKSVKFYRTLMKTT